MAAGVAVGATTAAIIGNTYYALPSGCYHRDYGGVLSLSMRIGLVLTALRRKRCLLCGRQSSPLSETRNLARRARYIAPAELIPGLDGVKKLRLSVDACWNCQVDLRARDPHAG